MLWDRQARVRSPVGRQSRAPAGIEITAGRPTGAGREPHLVSRALTLGWGEPPRFFHYEIDVERAPVRMDCRPIVGGCQGLFRPWERYDEVYFHRRIGGFTSGRYCGDGPARRQ